MTTALITGATSGIGLEITQILAKKYDLFLVSRDKKKLESLKKSLEAEHNHTVHVMSIDLSKENAAQKVFARAKRLSIDVLVNNAGFGVSGESVEADSSKVSAMLHRDILPPEGRGLLVSTTERSISTSVDLDVPQPISLIMCNPIYIFCPHVWQLTKVCSYNPS